MLRCEDCEYFSRRSGGQVVLRCSPFSTIKEPECLMKWQYLKLDRLAESYERMATLYERFAPLQERMFRHMERELDDMEESDRWKEGYEVDDEEDEFDPPRA